MYFYLIYYRRDSLFEEQLLLFDHLTFLFCFFFLKKIGEHKSFLWGHCYPCFGPVLTSTLGFKARVDSLACMLCHLWQQIPQNHLWCDTCSLLGSQHGSQAVSSIYLYTNIGGACVQDQVSGCLTACHKTDALPSELSRLDYLTFLNSTTSICINF